MKVTRQSKIIELINSKDIETQEQLTEELQNVGIEVTQATISRDIKELKLTKVLAENGKYKYTEYSSKSSLINKLVNIFGNTVLSMEIVKNFIIIKTISGSGSAAGETIDSLGYSEICGTIAGDNTILIVARSDEMAIEVMKKLKRIMNVTEK